MNLHVPGTLHGAVHQSAGFIVFSAADVVDDVGGLVLRQLVSLVELRVGSTACSSYSFSSKPTSIQSTILCPRPYTVRHANSSWLN